MCGGYTMTVAWPFFCPTSWLLELNLPIVQCEFLHLPIDEMNWTEKLESKNLKSRIWIIKKKNIFFCFSNFWFFFLFCYNFLQNQTFNLFSLFFFHIIIFDFGPRSIHFSKLTFFFSVWQVYWPSSGLIILTWLLSLMWQRRPRMRSKQSSKKWPTKLTLTKRNYWQTRKRPIEISDWQNCCGKILKILKWLSCKW